MRRVRMLTPVTWLGLTAMLLASGCEEVIENTLGLDQPAALAEADLPNCSRVVNCCNRLGQSPYTAVVPESVQTTCTETLGTASQTVIDEYQREQSAIQSQSGITDEQRTSLTTDLREQWQTRVEPGCRCFLEGTVGTLPDLTLPTDCESFTTTGTLAGGATCDDGMSAVIDTAANGL